MKINCREDIIRLPDVTSLRALKKQWNVKSNGPLHNRDDYVRLLLNFYDKDHERKNKVRIIVLLKEKKRRKKRKNEVKEKRKETEEREFVLIKCLNLVSMFG